jgi:hypothetical protein
MKKKEVIDYRLLIKTIEETIINMEVELMAKRKAEYNAVEKYSKTPHKNVQDTEFTAEFANDDDSIRFANRNSKLGKKGRS